MKTFLSRPLLVAVFLSTLLPVDVRAQTSWTNQTVTVRENIWSAAYGANKYVLVGTIGLILTSSDGSQWTRRTSNVTDWLVSVCYGNGLFVAVGDRGRILISIDGITWSTTAAVTTFRLNGVVYAKGVYVAVGEGGTIVSSTDGVRWTLRDSRGLTTGLHGIIYTGGAFIASGQRGRFVRSTDGVTWSVITGSNLSADCENLVAAQGLIAVVTSGTVGEIWTARDISGPWTRRVTNTAGYLEGITYGPKGFVAAGAAGSVLTSIDGITWTSRGLDTELGLYGATFLYNRYLAYGQFGALYMSSVPFGSVPTIIVPPLLPPGATRVESRAMAQQFRGAVIVAISGEYPANLLPPRAAYPPVAQFTNPQPYNLSYVVRLLSNGQPDPTFTSSPGGDGTVNAIATQPDGKILVGGTFLTFANTTAFRNLARLMPDGAADPSFNIGSGPASRAGASAQVNAIALQSDGAILVGGSFDTFQGQARPFLVRLSANGTLDSSFAPGLNGLVNAIVVQPDGKILVGGNFTAVVTSASTTLRGRIVRLQPTGAVDPTFDPGLGANSEVVALARQADGAILVGGDFTQFRGIGHDRLVRLLSDGTFDPSFSSSLAVNNTVIAIGLDADNRVLLGGAFTEINRITRNHVARLLPSGVLDDQFDPGLGANNDVRAVLPRSDGAIFFAGLFDQYGGTPANGVVGVVGEPAEVTIIAPPQPASVAIGGTAGFTADATGTGAVSYQWFKDGVAISGATAASLVLPNVTVAADGRYSMQAVSGGDSVMSDGATLTVTRGDASRIINLSVLTALDAQDATFTLGFVIGGTGTSGAKSVLVRAVGPSLATFGVNSPLPDPRLRFFAGANPSGENDNWGGSATLAALMAQVGAFALPSNSKDAVLSPANLISTSNSVEVSAIPGGTGAVLAEVYDATPTATAILARTPRLINVSVLKRVAAGEKLTAGFVIGAGAPSRVIIRAIGPGLAASGVVGFIGDPQLALFRSGAPMATNDNWGGSETLRTAFASVGAFSLNAGSADAALLVSLPPGSYTAEASGVGNSTGLALIEIYEAP